jgi:excisionase family DNA binding protein
MAEHRRSARRHPLMVTREVAELFRVTPTTVIRWAEKGRITCSRTIGGHRRFPRDEIEELARSAGIALIADARPVGSTAKAIPAGRSRSAGRRREASGTPATKRQPPGRTRSSAIPVSRSAPSTGA